MATSTVIMRHPQPQKQGTSCNACCVQCYESFCDIPWRVYCKKGCKQDNWKNCKEVCRELCYKDPIVEGKFFQWTALLDRSPGEPSNSRKCVKACVRGCGFKFHNMATMLEASIREQTMASKT